MYEIITIGSSLIDSFIKSDKFGSEDIQSSDSNPNPNFNLNSNPIKNICLPFGEKIDIDQYLIRSGGGGSNTAVGFARMGFRTGLVTEIGTDILSSLILKNLRDEFVSTNLVVSEKQEKTGGSIILVGNNGERTVLVHRGASSMLDPKDIPDENISRANWIHMSSISGRLETLNHVFSVIKKSNKSFSWNPGKKELALIESGELIFSEIPCNFLFLNYEEWESIKNIQNDILSVVSTIIVTNGKKGGKVFINGEINLEFSSDNVKPIDDTGAGDSFVVGYMSAFLKGKNVSECCEWGKRNASSVVQHIGAKSGLLTIDQIAVHN